MNEILIYAMVFHIADRVVLRADLTRNMPWESHHGSHTDRLYRLVEFGGRCGNPRTHSLRYP
jgi:hypothetical protein